ncbi:zinc finger protein 37-like [Uranotaenia lowii]|uniref:zinc finger protein 37-like n=1 Tax=Uranotaenia lowii TaxID=190385 RepID=UPI00247A305E|nr:zinc finger protein 37-like [Uranotaenia lowii]
MQKHQRVHTSRGLHKCPIQSCQDAYRYRSSLNNHISEFHFNRARRIYECHECGKMFDYASSTSTHLIRIHGYERSGGVVRFSYRCEADGKFKLASFLRNKASFDFNKNRKARRKKMKSVQLKEQTDQKPYLKYKIQQIKSINDRLIEIEMAAVEIVEKEPPQTEDALGEGPPSFVYKAAHGKRFRRTYLPAPGRRLSAPVTDPKILLDKIFPQ